MSKNQTLRSRGYYRWKMVLKAEGQPLDCGGVFQQLGYRDWSGPGKAEYNGKTDPEFKDLRLAQL